MDNKGVAPHKELIRTTCPVCGNTSVGDEFFFRDFSGAAGIVPFLSYKVFGCPKCGMMYAGNLVKSQELDQYYAKMSRYEGDSFVLSDKVKQFYNHTADFILTQVSNENSVMDIGCAFGGLLASLKDKGFTKLNGLEFSEKNARYAWEHYAIKVINGGLGIGYVPSEKYDLVILSGVLEHLVDLHEVLEEIKLYLNKGGRLFLSVPDLADFANHADLFQEFSVEHINYFNIHSLSVLLGSHGFSLVHNAQDTIPLYGLCKNLFALFEYNNDKGGKPDVSSSFEAINNYLQVSQKVAQRINENLKHVPMAHGCYIWGGGTQTQMLFQLGFIKESDVRLVIDANPNYHGESFYGTRIVAPDELFVSEDLPIIISSQYAQDAIERQIKDMQLKNKVYKLF